MNSSHAFSPLAPHEGTSRNAIRSRDAAAFESSYQRMIDRANHFHEVFGKPYIKWVTPASPPEDLDLTAGADE